MPAATANANAVPINHDQLADEVARLASELHRNLLTSGCPGGGKSNACAHSLAKAPQLGQVIWLTDGKQAIPQFTTGRR
jgi:hypothetical protein